MGVIEQAVDAAANFVGPYVDAGLREGAQRDREKELQNATLVREAIRHLEAINVADLAADPDAPYDASLAGVVYGLLDLITSLGILPYLSPGVAFSQRPRSVLITTFTVPSRPCDDLLPGTLQALLSILNQKEGTGLQPLIDQRSLPDIISALAELSFSPQYSQQVHATFQPAYDDLIARTTTSRLLAILTTFLQQPLAAWLKPRMSKDLALVPLRPHGVRHVIEFLSLSYLSKNSQVPRDASGPQSQIPIPLEAVTQASRLLISPPKGLSQVEWIQELKPQLCSLLDGTQGRELSRAAGQIIAGGILSKKATGAPGTVGWKCFAQPILQNICPQDATKTVLRESTGDRVLVQDQDLLLSLQRLYVITISYSHAGLIKRLVGPLLLSLWAMHNYARSKRSLDKAWSELPRNIITRYLATACDPKQVDNITTKLFWDGPSDWKLAPGTQGGIEIRMRRDKDNRDTDEIGSIFSRIGDLTERVDSILSMLVDANVSDEVAGLIFLQVTRRWLRLDRPTTQTLLLESDEDPLTALSDAKLSEGLASTFKDKFARSPQHIIGLMDQLLQNFVSAHRTTSDRQTTTNSLTRATLGDIVASTAGSNHQPGESDSSDDDIVSFAISILRTLITTPNFQRPASIESLLSDIVEHLEYLTRPHSQAPIPAVIANSASSLLQVLRPEKPASDTSKPCNDPLAEYRSSLQIALQDLTSAEAPNRTWAVNALHKVVRNSNAFPLLDIPSTTYLVLSASLADPESYVHTAAIPVLVDLADRAPHPVIGILADAFLDVDERSLRLSRGKITEAKEQELQEALDYRLRVGEVLNNVLSVDHFLAGSSDPGIKYTSIRRIAEACLSLASRRGQRQKSLKLRETVSLEIVQQQEEAEAAWGGPIPNILDADSESSAVDRADYEALDKIVKSWENTGVEEDVRIRSSALSIFGTILERRLDLVSQTTVDAGLQIVLLVLTMETAPSFFILRRAAVLVVMGLLRALDANLDAGEEGGVGLGSKQQDEIARVLRWSKDQDSDDLVRDHAANVLEGLETLALKKLYRIRNDGMRLGPDLGLEGGLRGLNVRPEQGQDQGKQRMVVEEID